MFKHSCVQCKAVGADSDERSIRKIDNENAIPNDNTTTYQAVVSGMGYLVSSDRRSYSVTRYGGPLAQSLDHHIYQVTRTGPNYIVLKHKPCTINRLARFIVSPSGNTFNVIREYKDFQSVRYTVTRNGSEYDLGNAEPSDLAKIKPHIEAHIHIEAFAAFDVGIFLHELERKKFREDMTLLHLTEDMAGLNSSEESDPWVVL